jgi:acetyltransferase
MEQTRIFRALRGVRGRRPADLEALERAIVRFSQLVAEQPWFAEIDLNPLLASHQGIVVLDARIVLHPAGIQDAELPRPAIRPYPAQYASEWKLSDGTSVVIRPIRPEDEPLMVKFHHTLSERSVMARYFRPLSLQRRVAHARLARLCFIDYDREMALVVEHQDVSTGEVEIIAVGRFCRSRTRDEADVAIIVSDRWQRHGIGTELLQRLVRIARLEGVHSVKATVLPDNYAMREVGRRVGFQPIPFAATK